MKTTTAVALAHLNGDTTRLAVCWAITKRDGTTILGTEHDDDVEIVSGNYAGFYQAGANISSSDVRSTADAAVDNMEVSGGTRQEGSSVIDVSVADIESGNLDGAPVVVFVCDWQNPDSWQLPIKHGYLGEISRTSDGGYTTELRGIKQLLTQVFVRTYSTKCQVKRFGDSECGLSTASRTYTGSVTAVSNRARFDGSTNYGSPTPAAGTFRQGELTFTSGANAGFMREVKLDNTDGSLGQFSFWEPFPEEVEVGDAYSIVEGCDREFSTCQAKSNQLNFRGYGIFIEGQDALTRGPT